MGMITRLAATALMADGYTGAAQLILDQEDTISRLQEINRTYERTIRAFTDWLNNVPEWQLTDEGREDLLKRLVDKGLVK